MSVSEIILHPSWDKVSGDNSIGDGHDIALIKLANEVPMSPTISLVCLPDRSEEKLISTNKEVDVYGFGLTEDFVPSDVLMKGVLEVSNKRTCR